MPRLLLGTSDSSIFKVAWQSEQDLSHTVFIYKIPEVDFERIIGAIDLIEVEARVSLEVIDPLNWTRIILVEFKRVVKRVHLRPTIHAWFIYVDAKSCDRKFVSFFGIPDKQFVAQNNASPVRVILPVRIGLPVRVLLLIDNLQVCDWASIKLCLGHTYLIVFRYILVASSPGALRPMITAVNIRRSTIDD